jgi:predicted secreted protein
MTDKPTKPETDQDRIDRAYILGQRSVWLNLLRQALPELNAETRSQLSWVSEREQAIAALRRVCEEHGDNDWDESLHLADIIDKHLGRHLGEGGPASSTSNWSGTWTKAEG